jgi:hypothetical protein
MDILPNKIIVFFHIYYIDLIDEYLWYLNGEGRGGEVRYAKTKEDLEDEDSPLLEGGAPASEVEK